MEAVSADVLSVCPRFCNLARFERLPEESKKAVQALRGDHFPSLILHHLPYRRRTSDSPVPRIDDVLDALLDIEHLECDPLTVRDSFTPLHTCVQYAKDRDTALGTEMARMCCDAGCDPRVKDKYNRKPIDLVNDREGPLKELWDVLRMEEYKLTEMVGVNTVVQDEEDEASEGPSDEE